MVILKLSDLDNVVSSVIGRPADLNRESSLVGDNGLLDSLAIGALLLEIEELTERRLDETQLTIEVFLNAGRLLDYVNGEYSA